jgi:hypothetical protein
MGGRMRTWRFMTVIFSRIENDINGLRIGMGWMPLSPQRRRNAPDL